MKTLFIVLGDSLKALSRLLDEVSSSYEKVVLLVHKGLEREADMLEGARALRDILYYNFKIDMGSQEGIISLADIIVSESGTPSLAIVGRNPDRVLVAVLNVAYLLSDYLEKLYIVSEDSVTEMSLLSWRLTRMKDYEKMVLRTLSAKREMKLRELATRLGRSSSYVNKILGRLLELGLVERGSRRGLYRITPLGKIALTISK